jgi:hypothetical protein
MAAKRVVYSIPQELIASFALGTVATLGWSAVGSAHRNGYLEKKAKYQDQETALVEAMGSKIAQKVAAERANNDRMLALKAKFPTYDPKAGALPAELEAALITKHLGGGSVEDVDQEAYAKEHVKIERMLFMASEATPWNLNQEIFVLSCMQMDDEGEIIFTTPESKKSDDDDEGSGDDNEDE